MTINFLLMFSHNLSSIKLNEKKFSINTYRTKPIWVIAWLLPLQWTLQLQKPQYIQQTDACKLAGRRTWHRPASCKPAWLAGRAPPSCGGSLPGTCSGSAWTGRELCTAVWAAGCALLLALGSSPPCKQFNYYQLDRLYKLYLFNL